ncbi:MAG TPA: alpha/beta hydrolase [Baekduia sp.]|nr:alpha/beta hydrolase [Baekduia sp.]
MSRTWDHYTEPETVVVRELPVAYRRQGRGAPLLYLHGANLTRRWLPLYEELAQSFDTIVPEHPGFGDTPRPPWLSEFSDVVLHYADLLNTLDVGPVHLVGHGLGGWIAAEFAAFYPERLASLTLICPFGLRPESDEKVVDLFRLVDEDLQEALLGDDAARWASVLDEGDVIEAKVQEYLESVTVALLSWNPRYDLKLERRLGRVEGVRSQVLIPEEERIVPLSVGRHYSELLPDSRLLTVPGSSARTQHLMTLQEPEAIANLIVDLANKGTHA